MSAARSSKGCLRLERNREGILYFRQPKGVDEVTTWHIYPSGEELLRQAGVDEGTCLKSGLLKKLKTGEHLYTKSGNPQALKTQINSQAGKRTENVNDMKHGNAASAQGKSRQSEVHPIQRTFSWGFGLRRKQKFEKRTHNANAKRPTFHGKREAAKSQKYIHPGWLAPQRIQDSADEEHE
jgi:hypothetical protein